jgi:hypothetical protein
VPTQSVGTGWARALILIRTGKPPGWRILAIRLAGTRHWSGLASIMDGSMSTTRTGTPRVEEKLRQQTGIDLTELPTFMTPQELAPAIRKSVGALSQDRLLNRGIPYIKMGTGKGCGIRYARADVATWLLNNRVAP